MENNILAVTFLGRPLAADADYSDAVEGGLSTEWDNVLKIAAGKGGAALATAFAGPEAADLGDAIGKAIYRSIMGDGPDPNEEFKREVLVRLERIESKLGEIIRFLQQDLARVTRVAASDALAIDVALELTAVRTTTAGFIASLSRRKAPPTGDEFAAALTAANRSFELGIKLAHYGQEWHAGVIHAYVSGLSLYGRLVRHRPYFRKALGIYANAYNIYAKACIADQVPNGYWVDPAPVETFVMAKRRIEQERVTIENTLARVRRGRVHYLLATNSPTVAHGGWFEMVDDGKGLNGNYDFWYPVDQAFPVNRDELIKKVTSALIGWEIPGFREIFEVAEYPRRDGYAETVAQLWSALLTEQRNNAAEPRVKAAIQAISSLLESSSALASEK